MSRFFFDIVSKQVRNFDFHGRLFGSPLEALQMAEILALDLGVSEEAEWMDAEIQVRDERGGHILSLPVAASSEAIAV